MPASITVEGLSKRYRLGQLAGGYDTLRDQLAALGRGGRRARTEEERELWALRDVSFEVQPGEVVGLIGRNGAGKTTLLRLLTRITEPTGGRAILRGRVGSLLEVGTGFHPELTGRENIYLNGSILGMRRSEISARFDEIVEFAGVERFLDTPVKRYSSGMYVRLAFSVAAHLEPEILLVDEVLAVGDAEFQRRSLGKMEEVGRSGRTVVFVSHNMATITRLCSRALLLETGRIVGDGAASELVARYLTAESGSQAHRTWPPDEAPGNEAFRLHGVRIVDGDGRVASSVDVREPVGVELTLEVLRAHVPATPWLALFNDQGAHVFSAMDTDPMWERGADQGIHVVTAWVPANLLNEGTIFVSVSMNSFRSGGKAERQLHVDDAVSFLVVDPAEGDSARGAYAGSWPGAVRPLLTWSRGVRRQDGVAERR